MMMVDGPDSMEVHAHPEESDEINSGIVRRNEETSQRTIPPTTTISTIAVQSGETRVVIALLQVRKCHAVIDDNLYSLFLHMSFLSFIKFKFKFKKKVKARII